MSEETIDTIQENTPKKRGRRSNAEIEAAKFAEARAHSLVVNVKKLSDAAVIPSYARDGDAGMDLTAVSVNENDDYTEYGTGIAVEIPVGMVGLIFPRSSISKYNLSLANSVGVIDSGYRGEVKLRFKSGRPIKKYVIGDKIGQLIIMPYPTVKLQEVSELSTTNRGTGGFGSTDS